MENTVEGLPGHPIASFHTHPSSDRLKQRGLPRPLYSAPTVFTVARRPLHVAKVEQPSGVRSSLPWGVLFHWEGLFQPVSLSQD